MSLVTPKSPPANAFKDLIRQVDTLRRTIEQQAQAGRETLAGLTPDRYSSAENLLHYLALRSKDIRPLQDRLARVGLSSPGRVEPHVMASISAVLRNLYLLSGQQQTVADSRHLHAAFDEGANSLEENTKRLFGSPPEKRRAHIIATISGEAADDYLTVHQLLKSGVNCMRINCARDTPLIWSRMIENLRNAERATGQSCRILMDLGGPKLRLGAMETIPAVLKIKPVRTPNGRVSRPACWHGWFVFYRQCR